MDRNFFIRDAVFFELFGEILDARELFHVGFRPGHLSAVEMLWKIQGSNQQIEIVFSKVSDFIVKGRDEEYPEESGSILSIAGFSNGNPDSALPELQVEHTVDMNYMTFVMNDRSAFAIKALVANMRQL